MKRATPGLADYLLLVGLAVIFGASFILTNMAVSSISPLTVATSRLLLATAMVYPLMRLKGQVLPGKGRVWVYIVAAAFFGNALPFALISWGQVSVDAGLTAILMAVMPLITVLLAHVTTTDEKMNRYKLVGVLCGLIGVVVLMGWDQLGSLGDNMVRQYAIAVAAICYAINAILTKKLTGIARLPMMTALMLVATLMLIPFALILEIPLERTPDIVSIGAVVALAIGPTALATLIILNIIDRSGASFLSQINFMVPLSGIFLAWLFLDEVLPASAWIALCIILAGIALSRLGNRQRTNQHQPKLPAD